MSKLVTILAALVVSAFLAVPAAAQSKASAATPDEKAVRAAVDQWFVVLNAMFAGDPKPFAALYSHADDVTYMGAHGSYRIGWRAIYDDWQVQAANSLGGKVHGEQIHVIVHGGMATASHFTKGTVRTAEGKVIDQRVRETSVFRKENGQWKIIAHHADQYPVWAKVVGR